MLKSQFEKTNKKLDQIANSSKSNQDKKKQSVSAYIDYLNYQHAHKNKGSPLTDQQQRYKNKLNEKFAVVDLNSKQLQKLYQQRKKRAQKILRTSLLLLVIVLCLIAIYFLYIQLRKRLQGNKVVEEEPVVVVEEEPVIVVEEEPVVVEDVVEDVVEENNSFFFFLVFLSLVTIYYFKFKKKTKTKTKRKSKK